MARKIEIQIVGDSKNFQNALGKASGSADGFGSSLATMGKMAVVAGAAVGGALAVGLVKSVKASVEFERSMRNVNSIAGLSEKEFDKLGKSVLNMASTVGQKPKVLADGLYSIVSSGFKANDAVKILAVSAKAATAGMTDTATASKAVTAALNAYHLGADEARQVSDVLFQTVNKGVLTFEELSQQMGDLVPASAPLGISLKEVGAGMSTLTLQGVPAAEAATRMKNAMLSLAKPTPALSALLKEQGFASGEAAIKSKGFAGVLEILSDATEGSVAAQAKLTPEIRTLLGVVGLTGKNLKTYNEHLRSMDEATRGAGITAKVFAEQSKSLAVQWQKTSAVIDVLKVQIGNALLPVLKDALKGISGFLGELGQAEGAGAKFEVAMDAIKATAAGLVTVFNNIDWSAAWDKLVASAETAATRLRDALDQKLGAVDWGNVGAKISDGIVKALQTVGAVGKKMGDAITAAMHGINWVDVGKVAGPGLAAALVTAFATLMDASFWIKNWDLALAVALAMFGKGLGKLVAPMGKLFKSLGDDAIQALVGGIETNSPKLAAALLAVLTKLPAIVAKGLALLFAPVKTAFTHLGGLAQFTVKVLGLTAAINAVVQFTQAVIAKLAEIVTAAITGGYAIGRGIVQGMLNGLASLAASVYAKAREIAEGAVNAAKGFLGIGSPSKVFEGIGADTIRGWILGITSQQPALEGKMKEAVGKALDAAKETVGRYQAVLGDAFGKLGEYVGRQFAAKTEAELKKIALKFDRQIARITARAEAATPAERELAGIAKSEDERNRERAKTEAAAALVAAQAMEEGVEKERAVAAAKEQIRKAELDNRVAGLEAQAVVERAAAEKQAAEQIAKLEAAKARELQNYEERRAQMEASLDKQLAALGARLAKHPEEYDKIQKQIQKLLASYGIPMQKAGENLGKAFARGIRDSIDDAVAAAKALAKAVAQYMPHSPAEKGPLSKPIDWSGYLTSGLPGSGSLAAAASRMAGGMVGGPSMSMAGAGGIGRGGGGGAVQNFYFPNYHGDKRELIQMIRTETQRASARN